MTGLRLVTDADNCPTCELLHFWRERMLWEEEYARIWEGWPSDREDDPPGSSEHLDREPRAVDMWEEALFEYADDGGEPFATLRGLACREHPEAAEREGGKA